MNKIFLFLLLVILFFASAATVTAQNKAGINIGTKYSDLDQAITTVGPGGWIVIIAGGTGDCSVLQEAINKTNAANVNLVIRGHLNNTLTPDDAKAWVATLGKLNSSKKIYFMPWNEPNQEGSADYAPPSTVVAYTDSLLDNLKQAGLGGKIFALSPAINQSHPNFSFYIKDLRAIKPNYFNQFNGIAMNLYDFSEGPSYQPLSHPDFHLNVKKFMEVLAEMGVRDKPAFGVESGTAGEYFYWRSPPNADSPLYKFLRAARDNNVNVEMLAIPSYDLGGEVGHTWSLFSPMDVANLLSSFPDGSATSASFDKNAFEAWLNPLLESGELISCGECGYAHKSNPGLCQGSSQPAPYIPKEGCNLNFPGEPADIKTSRPVPCEKCNQTRKMTPACAQGFTLKDEVKYKHHEGEYCKDDEGEKWMVEKSWGGRVLVDPSQTTIPFVGKKGQEDENKYLADYFEGTAFYYRPPYDLSKEEDRRKAWRESGVFRKLAPAQMQDDLKRAMVHRVLESKAGRLKEDLVRDYLVSYANDSAKLSEFNNHFPPRPGEENYEKKYEAWKVSDGGKWYRLWPAVPMFSREDTPGKIIPYLGAKIKDKFEIQDYEKSTVEKVPHLARLFELTRILNQLLLPAAQSVSGRSQKQSQTIVASAKESSSAEKTLLAESTCANCPVPSIINPYVENGFLHYALQICHSCSGFGPIGDVFMGPPCESPSQVHTVFPPCFSSDHPAIVPPVPISCPGTATTACIGVKANRDVDESCQGQNIKISCQVTVDKDCKITSSTCGAPSPPPQKCRLPKPSIDECQKASISGSGDNLCCSPITVNLTATDKFENNFYEPCQYDPTTGSLLNPSCNNEEIQEVHRQVGIALSHPYLEEIWNYTAKSLKGFFNIFRMEDLPPFEPTEASSRIRYGYQSASGKGSFFPAEGDFYFPFLGGLQEAKEWVVNALLPERSEKAGER